MSELNLLFGFTLYTISLPQRWNKHYCVLRDDKLYYAEEDEEQEEDPRKVKGGQFCSKHQNP